MLVIFHVCHILPYSNVKSDLGSRENYKILHFSLLLAKAQRFLSKLVSLNADFDKKLLAL